jgi:hypothetical protein
VGNAEFEAWDKTVAHKFSRQQDRPKRRQLPIDMAPYPRIIFEITPHFFMQYFKLQSSNLKDPLFRATLLVNSIHV